VLVGEKSAIIPRRVGHMGCKDMQVHAEELTFAPILR